MTLSIQTNIFAFQITINTFQFIMAIAKRAYNFSRIESSNFEWKFTCLPEMIKELTTRYKFKKHEDT